jgi:transmembrane sensor
MIGQERDTTSDEAAAWVARMDSEHWTELDEAELQAWFKGDPKRAMVFFQTQASWTAIDDALPDLRPRRRPLFGSHPGLVDRRTILAGGGAALAASLAGGFIWANSVRTYRTERGEIRRVPLADGSVATINTMSKINVRLAGSRRQILIEEGEAWFQVAKDASRPFLVSAGRIRAQAVGTAFSVRKRDEGADVIVTEGTVAVWANGAEGALVRLKAGEAAFVAKDAGVRRLPHKDASGDSLLAWRAGKIRLVGEPLGEAVSEFNRYNERQIMLAEPAIAGELFDGLFRIDDPEGFALAVKNSLNVAVDLSKPSQIRIGGRPE